MSSEDLYNGWRIVNLVLAVIGPVALWQRKIRYDFSRLPADMRLSSLVLIVWPVGYFAATFTAMLSGISAGPWTCIMWVPLIWTLASAYVRREPKGERP